MYPKASQMENGFDGARGMNIYITPKSLMKIIWCFFCFCFVHSFVCSFFFFFFHDTDRVWIFDGIFAVDFIHIYIMQKIFVLG